MDLELRERRRKEAANEGRRRAGVAIVLAILAHLIFVPVVALVFTLAPAAQPPKDSKVEFVQVPAAQWDAVMGGPQREGPKPPSPARPTPPAENAEEKKPDEEKPEPPPGQVVETSPGNGESDPNARLAAETSNKTDKETIARDRQPGSKVTMPQRTTSQKPAELPPEAPSPKSGKGLAIGEPGKGQDAQQGKAGSKLEIPSVEKQDKLALKPDPKGAGGFENRDESAEVKGNSDRFRLQVGDGEGDDAQAGAGGPPGDGKPLRLFPDRATLDAVTGGPAPDHVEGVDEGDGTFLNTREWKFASFFNRVKRNVSETWDPITELRRRDPTGEIYAWKTRHTLLSVTLSPDGKVADVYVEKSSGVDFLDREAIAAFQRAQPFPNPPRGLVDGNGQIRFQFGFFLETGRSGFRIFRGP